MLKCAARHDVPVLFHDGTPPYSTTFQIAALARWVPEAKIVLGHGGLGDYVYPAGQLLRDLPNLNVAFAAPKPVTCRISWRWPARAEYLLADVGFSPSWTFVVDFLDNVLEAEIPKPTLQKVLFDNAARLLHLKERPL